ncbi:MAG: hypothetical protein QXP49_04175 [Nitrososphaerota archaeon]
MRVFLCGVSDLAEIHHGSEQSRGVFYKVWTWGVDDVLEPIYIGGRPTAFGRAVKIVAGWFYNAPDAARQC